MDNKDVSPKVGEATQPQQPSQGQPEAVAAPEKTQTDLPTGVKERTTEQFEKLKEHNKRLYEANQLLQQEATRKSQMEQQFSPIQQTQQAQQPKVEDYIETDPMTGERLVNTEKLNKAIDNANQRASRAETAVQSYIQQQQYLEEKKQTEEAFKAYPNLDPKNTESFDSELTRKTRAFLLDSMMNPAEYQGRPLTFKEAADLAQSEMKQGTVSEKKEAKAEEKETQKNLENKEQATLSAQGVSSSATEGPNPDLELTDLQLRSRKGDTWAIAQRLATVIHTGTPKSSQET